MSKKLGHRQHATRDQINDVPRKKMKIKNNTGGHCKIWTRVTMKMNAISFTNCLLTLDKHKQESMHSRVTFSTRSLSVKLSVNQSINEYRRMYVLAVPTEKLLSIGNMSVLSVTLSLVCLLLCCCNMTRNADMRSLSVWSTSTPIQRSIHKVLTSH